MIAWARVGLPGTMAALAVFGMTAGSLGRRWWPCELFSHFRLQYTGLLLLAAAGFAAGGAWAVAGVAAVCGTALAASVATRAPRPADPPRQMLRVAVLNVFYRNHAYLRGAAFIRQAQPDLALLVEATQGWVDALRAALPDYPHVVNAVRADGHGMALLSRLPLEEVQVLALGEAGFPSIQAAVRVNGFRLSVLGTHPYSPMGPRHFALRNDQLLAVARHAAGHDAPLLLIGDLNLSPWSPLFSALIRTAGLRDSREGFGIQPTWPAFLWPPLRIPIDHCLVSPGVVVHRRHIGPAIGSDHLPVVVDCSVGTDGGALTGEAGTGRRPGTAAG